MMLAALPIEVASETVTGFSVIHSLTRASLVCTLPATAARRSRSVRIPMSRPKSMTRAAPTPLPAIFSAAPEGERHATFEFFAGQASLPREMREGFEKALEDDEHFARDIPLGGLPGRGRSGFGQDGRTFRITRW